MDNKLRVRWDVLVSAVVERKVQFDNFVKEIEKRSTYFIAPASPGYHCNWEGGLLEHSLNVAENALRIKELLAPGISSESCVICGLFHDLGKAPLDWPYYIPKEPTAQQKKYGYVPYPQYKYNPEYRVFMTVPQYSVRAITQYIPLTDMEYQAILVHDGQYVEENSAYACKENPLALILHYADSWSGFIMEGSDKQSVSGKDYVREYSMPEYLYKELKIKR